MTCGSARSAYGSAASAAIWTGLREALPGRVQVEVAQRPLAPVAEAVDDERRHPRDDAVHVRCRESVGRAELEEPGDQAMCQPSAAERLVRDLLDAAHATQVVQHRPDDYHGMLADLLGRHTPLRVKEAEDGETLRKGTVFLAPPGNHLLLNAGGVLSLSRAPKVHHVRPSADPLFKSVAVTANGMGIPPPHGLCHGNGIETPGTPAGIRPAIAQTIVQLGLDLGPVTTRATLADALELALERQSDKDQAFAPRR